MAIASDTAQHLSGKKTSSDDQRLAELLFDSGTLTEQDFKRILAAQSEQGGRFSEVAQRLGLVTERDVRRAMAQQCELPAVLPDTATFHPRLTAVHQPFSAQAEALRSLRSELLLRWFAHGERALAVAETRPHQGATSLAGNLAWLLAQLGRRTLLLDANLRSAELHTLFKLKPALGLANYLGGTCDLVDALHAVPGMPQLSVMFAGKPPGNPQELIGLASFGYLLETLPEQFDAVIVCGPPMLSCADMQLISAHTGGCLLTIRRHKTYARDVERVKTQLQATGVTLVGMTIDG